ncbi:hypothetical protein BJ875DRAFT_455230 [Amylocarpus encephaloides]|uniref:Uncharacterized protein n=1 Tax=Amylocarpus encephaloides TaxID=45428 RepID=A0A9P7YPM2_9HELO|nr:hypothetical protein BJ875DRAFT_455230 [Amylocarpus encephaloides]
MMFARPLSSGVCSRFAWPISKTIPAHVHRRFLSSQLETSRSHVDTTPEVVRPNMHQITLLLSRQDLEAEKGRNKFLRNLRKEFSFKSKTEALVILATPSFADLLENHSFMLRLVASVTKFDAQKTVYPTKIDVVCACVDRLSPGPGNLHYGVDSGSHEGFSIVRGRSDHLLPGLWNAEPQKAEEEEHLSTLTFSGRSNFNTEVTFPLANTIFTNGKLSTLLISEWRVEPNLHVNGGRLTKGKTISKKNQVVNIFDNMNLEFPHTYIPAARPITNVRKIVSGLGNIVRQLEFDDHDVGPASRELEEAANHRIRSLSAETLSDHRSEVWALVVPGEIAESALEKRFSISRGALLNDRQNQQESISKEETSTAEGSESVVVNTQRAPTKVSLDLNRNDYIGRWIRKGAIFCRVLSGGGGWGAKQGLLSLDPQTTYHQTDGAALEFLNEYLEHQQTSALGKVAQPGAYIQFFGMRSPKQGWDRLLRVQMKWYDPACRSVIIGTCPNTIDDMPKQDNQKYGEPHTPRIRVRAGQFGCVSETGIFIRQRQGGSKPDFETKLDLPYSYLMANMGSAIARDPKPSRRKAYPIQWKSILVRNDKDVEEGN